MKKALSLFLAVVTVALMIPFAAIMASASDTVGPTEENYLNDAVTELYSLDFSTISSETELNDAGWYEIVASGASVTSPIYGEDSGMKYVFDSNANLVFSGVKFNTKDNYVVDYTFKWSKSAWVAYNSFSFEDTSTYMSPTGILNTTSYKFRANEESNAGAFDGASIYKDAGYTAYANSSNKSKLDAAGVTNAFTNLVDCRIRIFLEAGKTQCLIYTVGTTDYYVKLNSQVSIPENGLFGFAHAGGNGGGNRAIILKDFSVSRYTFDTPVYSVDFTKVDSETELNDAGWYYPAKSETTPKALGFGDEGLEYGISPNASLIFGGVAFNSSDNYVIDYTFKWNKNAWIVQNHFLSRSTDSFVNTSTGTNNDKWLYRGNEGDPTAKMAWDSATFYIDAYHTEKSSVQHLSDADTTAAFSEFCDVNVRIYVEAGASQYATVNVSGIDYYIKKENPVSVSDGSYFAFGSGGGENSTRGMILKSFSVWSYGETAADPAELACVETDGVKRYVASGSAVKVSEHSSEAIGVKTPSGYADTSDFTVLAGERYEILTTEYISTIVLTAGTPTLRLAKNAGIRYTTAFRPDDLSFINALVNNGAIVDLKMGTVVTTEGHAAEVGEITKEALSAYGESVGKNVYIDIVADAGALYAENTFAGSIIGVKSYTIDYVAAGYIEVTFADGTKAAAYSDTAAASVSKLAYAITKNSTEYAKYSATEKEALDYLASNVPYGYAPAYEGSGEVEFLDSFERSDSHYIIIHEATQTDFRDYTEKLAGLGYQCHYATTANGNLFETWTDGYTILTLSHIAYTDPATTDMVTASLGKVKYMSIAVDTEKNSALPTKDTDIEDITTEQITTVGTGCGYILRLSDGRFVVFDGGMDTEVETIYNLLVGQNARDGNPVIAAWFITHGHVDHIGAVNKFVTLYSGKVEIEAFVHNLPAYELYDGKNTVEIDPAKESKGLYDRSHTFYNNVTKYYPKSEIIIAHAGQRFEFGGIDIDVLFTPENIYRKQMLDTNMSSVVYSITGASGRMIILGDAVDIECPMLNAIYGSALKCDLVQVAHHGYNGGNAEMYANMDADYAIWSNSYEVVIQNKLHIQSSNKRNKFDYKTVTYNFIPSESGEPIILFEGMTKAQLAQYDAGLTG